MNLPFYCISRIESEECVIAIGGYINIGIVFDEAIHLPNAFRQLSNYLTQKKIYMNKVKFSQDPDGET